MASLLESIRKVQRGEIEEAVKFDGRTFKNTKSFNDDDSANAFMQKNKDWGVVGTKGGKVFLAPMKDMGEGFEPELEVLDEAGQPTFRVTIKKAFNKLKKGQSVDVKARNTAEAGVKAGKKFGDKHFIAAPPGSIGFERLSEEVIEEAKKQNGDEKLDRVDRDELKKDYEDREDKDIDNDGDHDDSDEYLHKRRKAISKALAKEEVELEENYEVMHNGKPYKYFDSEEEAQAAIDKMDLSPEEAKEYTIRKGTPEEKKKHMGEEKKYKGADAPKKRLADIQNRLKKNKQ